jgi:hypothetical protein
VFPDQLPGLPPTSLVYRNSTEEKNIAGIAYGFFQSYREFSGYFNSPSKKMQNLLFIPAPQKKFPAPR